MRNPGNQYSPILDGWTRVFFYQPGRRPDPAASGGILECPGISDYSVSRMDRKENFFKKLWSSLDRELDGAGAKIDVFRSKAREWEDFGILKLDIRKIDDRNRELLYNLGVVVFSELSEAGTPALSRDHESLALLIRELEQNRDLRDRKEKRLRELEKGAQ